MSTRAIETRYKGRLFRSRLEAHWAAMFDLLEWAWVYEPVDADRYIPDFAITGSRPLFAEVKPALTLAELEAHVLRVTTAMRDWQRDVVFLGASPVLPPDGNCCWDGQVHAGLLAEPIGDPDEPDPYETAHALWMTCLQCNAPGVFHEVQSYASRPCGHHDGDHYLGSAPDVRALWNLAGNEVRWEPQR